MISPPEDLANALVSEAYPQDRHGRSQGAN
jgi:hypothetical protein